MKNSLCVLFLFAATASAQSPQTLAESAIFQAECAGEAALFAELAADMAIDALTVRIAAAQTRYDGMKAGMSQRDRTNVEAVLAVANDRRVTAINLYLVGCADRSAGDDSLDMARIAFDLMEFFDSAARAYEATGHYADALAEQSGSAAKSAEANTALTFADAIMDKYLN